MGNWRYEGVGPGGIRKVGMIKASSEREARKILRSKKIRTKKLSPPSWLEFDFGEFLINQGFVLPFGNKELMTFTKQLSIMVEAGIPIIQSLEILFKQQQNLALKRTIKKMIVDIGEGKTVAESITDQNGFSSLYVKLIKAGEVGGILDEILRKLYVHMEKEEKIKSQIKSAMIYPLVVVLVGIGVIWGMMVFVVPKFVEMLEQSGKELPLVTKIVISVSEFMGTYSTTAIPVVILGGLIFKFWLNTPSGKFIFDQLMSRLPLFGKIIIKGHLASFMQTFSTMLKSGVPMIDALDICTETIDCGFIVSDLKKTKEKVVEGNNLSDQFKKISYFPSLITQMVKVGEETGRIDEMLTKCANVFETELETLIGGMTKMIEPMVIVVLGSIVSVILVAVYLPMFMSAGGA